MFLFFEQELERIQNAMKNNEFRKMFTEYAKEISDPENRKVGCLISKSFNENLSTKLN